MLLLAAPSNDDEEDPRVYTLEEWEGVERPFVIRRPTGEVLFTMSEHDRSFSESILAALNSGEALSSGDNDDDLANAA